MRTSLHLLVLLVPLALAAVVAGCAEGPRTAGASRAGSRRGGETPPPFPPAEGSVARAAATAPGSTTAAAARDDVRELRLENARLRGRAKLLEQELEESREAHRALVAVLKELEGYGVHPISPCPFPSRAPVPRIDTTVVEATAERTVLGAGLSAGLAKGMQLTVYRGVTFVGKVVVESCEEDRAAVRVLFTAPQQTVCAGDAAATRLD